MGREKNDGARDPNLSGPQMIGFTFWMAVFYFGTFFFIIVLAFVLADAVDDARADLDARDWTPVSGTIIASGVDSYSEPDGNITYCLRIEYEYGYENETYSGDMISHSLHSSTYDAADCGSGRRNADDYPPGEPITVYVNPDDPNRAVLLTGWSALDIGLGDLILYPIMIIVPLLWIWILVRYITWAYLDSVIALIRRRTG